jgi:hypothetical protein
MLIAKNAAKSRGIRMGFTVATLKGPGLAWVFSRDELLWILAFGDFRCRSFGMAADNLIFP